MRAQAATPPYSLPADGAAALQLALRERPAVVVSDVMMPGMTGLELARALRESLPGTPILLLSAKTALEDRLAGLEFADDYLDKPFRVAELKARVARLVRGYPVSTSTAMEPIDRADRESLQRLESILERHLNDVGFGVVELAKASAMSERSLRRELHRLVGQPDGR